MGKAPKAAYYAVQMGKETGVFRSWAECEAQVKGFQGAKYKRFDTLHEASAFLNGGAHAASSSSSAPMSLYPPIPPPIVPPRVGTSSHQPTGHIPIAENSQETDSSWLVVYTDGACKNNGKANAVAGIGVWFGHGDSRNLSERCPGPQTNNRAELIALIRAFQATPATQKLLIKSDSQYAMKCVTQWLPGWRKNRFRTSTGVPVSNLALIIFLNALLEARPEGATQFKYVEAHSGIPGNEAADRLAGEGCLLHHREEYVDEWDLRKVPKTVTNEFDDLSPDDLLSDHELTQMSRTQRFD